MDKPVIFFDGNCPLCHRWVKFVLRFDRAGIFNFSPQQGSTAKRVFSADEAAILPDSIFVVDTDDKIYLKSFGISFILKKLGGFWAFCGVFLGILPVRFNNYLYDVIAQRRKSFKKTADLCPLIPPALQARFLA